MRILGVVSSSSREVPNAPTIGTATDVGTARAFNNGAGTVTFTAPTFDGGLPITSYTATSNPGSLTATGAGSPLTVTGLTSSTAYTFTVRATNSVGQSTASAASNSITATTVPQAPTIGTATDGGTGSTVSVAFTGNATGGKAITTYTATSSPGGLTGTGASSPITVSGLTAGTAYTFTVTATNANGTSTASAASNSVTPAVPTSFDSIATFTPNGTATVTFSSIPQTYKHLQIRGNVLPSTANGTQVIGIQINGNTSDYVRHYLSGNGSSVEAGSNTNLSTTSIRTLSQASIGSASFPVPFIFDFADYTSTSKNKVTRHFIGQDHNNTGAVSGSVELSSGLSLSTSAISSISILMINANFASGSSIALYGIRG
jgi:hypothetical protein